MIIGRMTIPSTKMIGSQGKRIKFIPCLLLPSWVASLANSINNVLMNLRPDLLDQLRKLVLALRLTLYQGLNRLHGYTNHTRRRRIYPHDLWYDERYGSRPLSILSPISRALSSSTTEERAALRCGGSTNTSWSLIVGYSARQGTIGFLLAFIRLASYVHYTSII